MAQDWITTTEAVTLSGYTFYHVRYLLNTGKVKGQKWGREWQVSRTSLLDYVHEAEKSGAKRGPKSGT